MDFFENIDALLWRLAAILALVLVATLVVRLLLRDRGRSDRQQKLRVQQTLKGSGLAADKAPNGFTFGLLGGKKVYLPCDGEGHRHLRRQRARENLCPADPIAPGLARPLLLHRHLRGHLKKCPRREEGPPCAGRSRAFRHLQCL